MPTYDVKPLFKPLLDEFIKSLSYNAKDKLYKVINALRTEFELNGTDRFRIPSEKFKKNKLSNEDSRAILINLHNHEIVEVSCKLKIGYKPDRFSNQNIIQNPDIYEYPNTQIKLNKDKIIYLETSLKNIINPAPDLNYLLKIENSINNKNCIIGKNSLKLIAPKIDSLQSLKSNEELGRFLMECGVKKEFCIGLFIDSAIKPPSVSDVYSHKNILQTITNPAPLPNFEKYSRAQFIYRVMLFYSCSEHKKREILFKIIEDASHPLLFNADKKASEIFREKLNSILEFDGYCLENGKVGLLKNKKNTVINKEETTTYLDSGFDHFLIRRDPLQEKREADAIALNMIKGQLELQNKKIEIQHRQKLKNDRILATKQDRYEHALDVIIEKFSFQSQTNDSENIAIDYHYFNFEDRMEESRMLEAYFEKLRHADCFEKWERNNYAGGTNFSFFKVRLDKLNIFRKKDNKIDHAVSVIEKIEIKKNEEIQATNDNLFVLLGKHKLEVNKNIGTVKLNKVSTKLNPEGHEFKALIKLMTSKDYKATYNELLGDNPTKVNKRNLTFTIRNLKEALGILPEKNAKNKNIIKNIKNHGYIIEA